MANSHDELKLGPDSFWEMAALALDGWLASCQSCVEFYYFQSRQNATAFLDSCAEAGLVERVSLLYLKAGADSDSATEREWYDQPIYISAPAFRKLNLDLAREKIENTANAVYGAFYIYYELLEANDSAINMAYSKAVDQGQLRHSEIAMQRLDVDLSPVAKLRLILDGFRSTNRSSNKKLPSDQRLSGPEIEKRSTDETVEYVLDTARKGYRSNRNPQICDRAEELEKFICDFVSDPFALKSFSREKNRQLPEGFHIQLLSVISELCRRRYQALNSDPNRARKFDADIKRAVRDAQARWAKDTEYVAALTDLFEDLDFCEQMPASAFGKDPSSLQGVYQSTRF